MRLPSIQQQAHRPNTIVINKVCSADANDLSCKAKKTACYNNDIKEYNINKDEKSEDIA